ncbi:HNH endonuclease [Luteibacter yeojuensis]|uniref:HNH endonuclease n=1 Tax=Luteibacter yeojuensis TaxID=345309 RepID=A0A7X5QS38_9GAMM|nr:HNH endonuclease [Luteibacter yeojuensis]
MARNRAGRCCEHCHMSEAEHQEKFKMRLNVNHKEPFHQHANKSLANRLSNLEALCKSCHTRADWKWRKEHPMQAVLNFRAA